MSASKPPDYQIIFTWCPQSAAFRLGGIPQPNALRQRWVWPAAQLHIESPAMSWQLVQGVHCPQPKTAGIGSSKNLRGYRQWMDGWMDKVNLMLFYEKWQNAHILYIIAL